MDLSIVQLALLLFVAAIGLVAFEMQSSLKPPVCPECAHCRSEQEASRRQQQDVRDFYRREYGWRDRDEDER
jgi:hypothetical protein